MQNTVQFRTFHEMATVMSQNVPHALVQDWWSRLERTIRSVCRCLDAPERQSIARLIDTYLRRHPRVPPSVISELHRMRQLRNNCAHGEAPSLSSREASAYAYRAWEIAWDLAVGPQRTIAGAS